MGITDTHTQSPVGADPRVRPSGAGVKLLTGDSLHMLETLADNGIDAIVTDPPYGLSFMGKKWDYSVPSVQIWRECLRVLKPGGHLLAFAGTRTQHRMAVNIEDAGFEIRDMIAWLYGSGFPKALDVGKSIDKHLGAEREVVGRKKSDGGRSGVTSSVGQYLMNYGNIVDITAPASPQAQQWDGWRTALKPALEPITVARKPLIGTVTENVLTYGTGAYNIDACRIEYNGPVIETTQTKPKFHGTYNNGKTYHHKHELTRLATPSRTGRYPANLIHDGSPDVLRLFPNTDDALPSPLGRGAGGEGDSPARFFYCAKASKDDRDAGLAHFTAHQYSHDGRHTPIENPYQRNNSVARNNHPTVKPTDLMRYLVRLVTPPGGTVLDPFMGSGSTGKACKFEGFNFVGIEMDPRYVAIAQARIAHVTGKDEEVVIPDQPLANGLKQLSLFSA